MRAIVVRSFGGPEVLELADLPEPHAGPGEVRIRVRAATVNPTDTALRAGLYGDRLTSPPPHIPGMEAAGEVDEVGEGAGWAVGDAVMGIALPTSRRGGAYAERIVLPAGSVARVPEGHDFITASTLPMNGLTARLTLDRLALAPGATLAVTGAAGAYGGYVVQLARADGLRVVADASEADEDLVRSFGADVVVRRGPDVAGRIRAAVPGGVDALADGSVQNAEVLPAIRDGGALASVRRWTGPSERGITLHAILVSDYARNHEALDRLRVQVEEGRLSLRVARTFSPEAAAEAHRQLEAGGTRGRLVIRF